MHTPANELDGKSLMLWTICVAYISCVLSEVAWSSHLGGRGVPGRSERSPLTFDMTSASAAHE